MSLLNYFRESAFALSTGRHQSRRTRLPPHWIQSPMPHDETETFQVNETRFHLQDESAG